jgi:hypothetical protein
LKSQADIEGTSRFFNNDAAPEGTGPIRWMLVTTLPIETNEHVQRVISWYCVRWQIEVYSRTLKSSCKIEPRRFEAIDRVFSASAFFSVIDWRVLYVCHLRREYPWMDCEVMFEPSEWKSVYSILGKPIPSDGCPSLNDVVRNRASWRFHESSKGSSGNSSLMGWAAADLRTVQCIENIGPQSKKISTD